MAFNGKGVGPYSAKVYQTTDSSGMSHELYGLYMDSTGCSRCGLVSRMNIIFIPFFLETELVLKGQDYRLSENSFTVIQSRRML